MMLGVYDQDKTQKTHNENKLFKRHYTKLRSTSPWHAFSSVVCAPDKLTVLES